MKSSIIVHLSFHRGFAFYTMKERLPIILTQVIDQLSKDKEQIVQHFGEVYRPLSPLPQSYFKMCISLLKLPFHILQDAREELKQAIGEISKLKYELQTDKEFTPIATELGDEQVWNDFIAGLGNDNSYYSACWLYAETYMYRRLNNIFEST